MSSRASFWRRWIAGAAFLASLLLASNARAVILYSTATRNTSAPSEAQGLDAWNLQAVWGGFLATPIDSTHFIAAKHITDRASTVVFQGVTYEVDLTSRKTDSGSDLCIYTLQSGYAFPTYAPLYNTLVDGPEVGKTLTVIGRGTQRGNAVSVGDDLKGWEWGADDRVQSWGQNVVSGYVDYSSSSTESLLYFDFNSDGIDNEASLSRGDSSGGVFIYANGQWKLAGINYGVDSPFSLTGDAEDPGFFADIFDARGLYYKDEDNQWTLVPLDEPDPISGAGYSSRISARLDWIAGEAPGAIVPEPGHLALVGSAAMLWLLWRSVASRRRRGGSI